MIYLDTNYLLPYSMTTLSSWAHESSDQTLPPNHVRHNPHPFNLPHPNHVTFELMLTTHLRLNLPPSLSLPGLLVDTLNAVRSSLILIWCLATSTCAISEFPSWILELCWNHHSPVSLSCIGPYMLQRTLQLFRVFKNHVNPNFDWDYSLEDISIPIAPTFCGDIPTFPKKGSLFIFYH